MAMVSSSSSTSHVLNHLLRPPPPPLLTYLRPFCSAANSAITVRSKHRKKTPVQISSTAHFSPICSLPTPSLLLCRCLSAYPLSSSPGSLNHSRSLEEELEEDELEAVDDDIDAEIDDDSDFDDDDDEQEEEDIENGREKLGLENHGIVVSDGSTGEDLKRNGLKLPNLTPKEKKELAAYAHGLGKKLKSQLVGKSGVTDTVVTSFSETLEANELLKIKIHGTCPGEMKDVVQKLEKATGSVAVRKIGRTVILYRPSLTKLKAEEKKNEARTIFVRKELKRNPASSSRRRLPRSSGRARRGSSRMQTK